eukprot:gene24566-30929_t
MFTFTQQPGETVYIPAEWHHALVDELVKKMNEWLRRWDAVHLTKTLKVPFAKDNPGAKAILLSSPPGIGKTTVATLIAKEFNYDVLELNASDTRNKKDVGEHLSDKKAADAVSDVDLAGARITGQDQHWELLPAQAAFSTSSAGSSPASRRRSCTTIGQGFCPIRLDYVSHLRSTLLDLDGLNVPSHRADGSNSLHRHRLVVMDEVAARLVMITQKEGMTVDISTTSAIKMLVARWANTSARPCDADVAGEADSDDRTQLSTALDRNYEKHDTDSALRPTIINTTKTLGATEQTSEKTTAFDLLDALSRSGALCIEDASLHVVIAPTHSFDESLDMF